MELDLEKLKTINAEATRGAWVAGAPSDAIVVRGFDAVAGDSTDSLEYYAGHLICESADGPDHRYIIAFNPQVTAELLRLAERAQRYEAALREIEADSSYRHENECGEIARKALEASR